MFYLKQQSALKILDANELTKEKDTLKIAQGTCKEDEKAMLRKRHNSSQQPAQERHPTGKDTNTKDGDGSSLRREKDHLNL